MERGFIKLNIAVVAVSEAGTNADATKVLVDRLGEAGHAVTAQPIDDTVQLIRAKLLELVADSEVDVVIVLAALSSESAGIALDPLITHGLPGFSDLLRMLAYQEIGSAAMLVDAEAAKCKSTFVFVLPALPTQVKLALEKLILPQLDYRTRPRNLVMQIPRVGHVASDDDAVVTPVKESTTTPMPWIVPRPPGAPAPAPAARTMPPPAPRKSMSMSVAEAMPSPSASMSAVLSKVSAAVSVSQVLPAQNPFAAHEPTTVGAAPAPVPPPPPVPRTRTSATISAPLPIKPPAKLVPLGTLLPVPAEPAPRKMVSLADLDDEGDDLDELDNGVAEIVDEPPPREAVAEVLALAPAAPAVVEAAPEPAPVLAIAPEQVVAEAPVALAVVESVEASEPVEPIEKDPRSLVERAADSLPPPRRYEDTLPPLFDDSPRRIAEPRAPRRGKALGLLLLALLLLGTTAALVIVILKKQDREARAATSDRGELVATRDPVPPAPAGSEPIGAPLESAAIAPSSTEPVPGEPKEIEMAPAEGAGAVPPSATSSSTPPASTPGKTSRPAGPATKPTKPLRDPTAEPVRDPADMLATAPVNKVEDGCDEVSCILDKYKQACCARFKPAEAPPPVEPKPTSGLPEKLDKLMVQEGMGPVKPAVIACGERIAVRGTVKVQVKVSPSGKVVSATSASAPDPELGACVANAVKLAKFPETDEGGSFGYPFVF